MPISEQTRGRSHDKNPLIELAACPYRLCTLIKRQCPRPCSPWLTMPTSNRPHVYSSNPAIAQGWFNRLAAIFPLVESLPWVLRLDFVHLGDPLHKLKVLAVFVHMSLVLSYAMRQPGSLCIRVHIGNESTHRALPRKVGRFGATFVERNEKAGARVTIVDWHSRSKSFVGCHVWE